VFSLPGIAAKGGGNGTGKAYSLVMDEQATYDSTAIPRSVIAPVKVQAILKNEAPPGVAASNVGSFELVITNPGVTIFFNPNDTDHQPSGATLNGPVNGTVVPIRDPATQQYTRLRVTNMSPLKAQQRYVLTFWVTSCGDALWDADVRAGASLSGDTFTRINDSFDSSTGLATNLQTLISCGTLACGNSVVLVADEASQSPELVVTRGPYNSDGACSAASDFFASNKLLTANGQVHFRWPVGDADQKLAVWTYSVLSTNANVPKLAWLNSDGSKASAAFPNANSPAQVPAYIDGSFVPCQPTNGAVVLPQPFGVLSNNVNQTSTSIKVNTSPQNAVLPTPTAPFDIVIGTERMHVTAAQGSTWTVQRAWGLTTATTHLAGAKLMSTPLPLLPDSTNINFKATLADNTPLLPAPSPYTYSKQAQMCVVGSPIDNLDGTWSTTIMDFSDGWVRVSQ